MATLDWCQRSAVESMSGKVSGAWLPRGSRKPVHVLVENLEAGLTIEELIERLHASEEQLVSLMAFVGRSLDKEPTYS